MKKAIIVSVTLLLVAIAAVYVSERSTPAARLADSVLVGTSPPYWDEFFLVGGDDKEAQPRIPIRVADAYVVRIETVVYHYY